VLKIKHRRQWGRTYIVFCGTAFVTLWVAVITNIGQAVAPKITFSVLDLPITFNSAQGEVTVPTSQITAAQPVNKPNNPVSNTANNTVSKYISHNVVATIFWLGEKPSADNNYITNTETEWDPNPVSRFGGYDDPQNRTNQGLPKAFTPLHNPFYCALPVSEYDNNGNLRAEARSRSPWAGEQVKNGESLLKGRWIKIQKGDNVVFCQWLDSGPYQEKDYNYVYGTAAPANTIGEKAGIDLSPTAAFALGINGSGTVSWRFADATEAAQSPGLWNDYTVINNRNYWQ
jgi:hypothetical protein